MLLEYRVEDVVGRRQEDHRPDEEGDHQQRVAQLCAHGVDDHRDERQQRHGQQAVVESDAAGGEERREGLQADARERHDGQVDDARAPAAVHHRLRKRAGDDREDEQREGREQERDDEERGDEQHGDAEPLVEPLAVEHEEERPEDDARAGVVLQHDDRQRQADHRTHAEEVRGPVDRERIFAHHARQGQRRGDLGELHGLHAYGPELEPRLGAVDLAAEEQRGDEQQEAPDVGGVGQHVVVAVVEQQHDRRHDARDADPHGLLHVEVREREELPAPLLVGGGRDEEEARGDDGRVEQDGDAVHAVEYRAGAATGHRRDSGFACS